MIVVLRLGHRPERDQRVTTHVALTARALGADEIWVSTEDHDLEKSVRGVVSRFGGNFSIKTGVEWRKAIRSWKGTVVHLTMYGERLSDALPTLRDQDLLIVVGAEKVPRAVYDLAHRNISVGSQPHSEIAALAILLDRHSSGKALNEDFGGPMKIVPNPRGKTVIDSRDEVKARNPSKQG